MQDSFFTGGPVLELSKNRKPAYIVDQDFRDGEAAEIVGCGFHSFRGKEGFCFETRFYDGEERLVPIDYLDQDQELKCWIIPANAVPRVRMSGSGGYMQFDAAGHLIACSPDHYRELILKATDVGSLRRG